jgi:hypothetical protein
LPTFFEVTWAKAGAQPGEIDTTTLLGHQVRIRPKAKSYTYYFGDETRFGPTTSPGGIYPNGDITHVYPKRGVYHTHIEVDYGGEYSVDGGVWRPIPGTVHISGPVQPLTVKASYARLIK